MKNIEKTQNVEPYMKLRIDKKPSYRINLINLTKVNTIIIFVRAFSVWETEVLVGGRFCDSLFIIHQRIYKI